MKPSPCSRGRVERLLPGDGAPAAATRPVSRNSAQASRPAVSQKRRSTSCSCRAFHSRTSRASVGRLGEQPRGRDRVLADAPDLVAGGMCRRAHARQRLFGRLVAQQPERGEGDRDDGEEHDPGDREEQEALERARPRDEAPQPSLALLGSRSDAAFNFRNSGCKLSALRSRSAIPPEFWPPV